VGGDVIFLGTVPIHDQPTTDGRIESAEDRAEQAAFDHMRES